MSGNRGNGSQITHRSRCGSSPWLSYIVVAVCGVCAIVAGCLTVALLWIIRGACS
jgi:hypothetical protein